jgi:hypothetical protein
LLSSQAHADSEEKQWIQVIYPGEYSDSEFKLHPHPNRLIFPSQSDCVEKLAEQLDTNPRSIIHAIPSCREKILFSQYSSDLKSKGVNFWEKITEAEKICNLKT